MKPGYWDYQREVEDWHFWFRTRRRILEALLARAEVPAGARILDVGCGAGGNAASLSRFGRVYGLDREAAALSAGRERPYAARVKATAERLPFRAGRFDVVVSLDLLEHLADDAAGVAELARVLKPGGLLCVFVPALRALWGYNDDLSEHRRRYTRGELVRAVGGAGLAVEYASYFNVLLAPPLLVVRRAVRLLGVRTRYEHPTRRGAMDRVLGALFGAEVPLIARGLRFPVGVSLACLGRKPLALESGQGGTATGGTRWLS